MKMPFRKMIWIFLRLSLGLGLIYLALNGIDWKKLSLHLFSLNYFWLILGIGGVVLGLFLKVLRWNYLLSLAGLHFPFITILTAFFSGQAANILLPFRGGEAVRTAITWSLERTSDPGVVTSIAFEKYLDLLFLSLFTFLAANVFPNLPEGWFRSGMVVLTGLSTLGMAVFLWLGPSAWEKIRVRLSARLRSFKLVSWVDGAISSMSGYRSLNALLKLLAFSFLIWGIMIGTICLLFESFSIKLPAVAAVLVVVTLYIGVIPALMPGNVGPIYFLTQLALQPFRVPFEIAAPFAIVLHAVITFPPLLIGGVSYLYSGKPALTPPEIL
jgi:uncharacterized protein (TIRG00374 family)